MDSLDIYIYIFKINYHDDYMMHPLFFPLFIATQTQRERKLDD